MTFKEALLAMTEDNEKVRCVEFENPEFYLYCREDGIIRVPTASIINAGFLSDYVDKDWEIWYPPTLDNNEAIRQLKNKKRVRPQSGNNGTYFCISQSPDDNYCLLFFDGRNYRNASFEAIIFYFLDPRTLWTIVD